MNKKMKLIVALLLSALLAAGAIAIGCDDDGGGGSNVCEEAANLAIDAMKKVCDDYPDCSMCQATDTTTETGDAPACEGATKDAAQKAIDEWDEAAYIEPLKAVCELEAGAVDAGV
jgi:hypothetical protein